MRRVCEEGVKHGVGFITGYATVPIFRVFSVLATNW